MKVQPVPTGKIEAVCLSRKVGSKKKACRRVLLLPDHGIKGDAHAGRGHRQISLLDLADVQMLRKKGAGLLPPGSFGENMIVSGMSLAHIGLGSTIRIGSKATISITQIGKTCHTRCGIFKRTGDCIMPRAGLFARVTTGGEVAPGDAVYVSKLIPRQTFQAVVITISDRCSEGTTNDTAGPATCDLLTKNTDTHVYRTVILPDDESRIADSLKHYADGHSIDLIITVGGTGFSPRDVTPEAVASVITRPTPGLDEAMRSASLRKTPHAMLSRCVSGIRGTTLIVSLPGAKRAAVENLSVVLPALEHGLAKLRGDRSDCVPGRKAKRHVS